MTRWIGIWVALSACGPEVDHVEALRFGLPLTEPHLFYQTTGFDHDPTVQETVIGRALCEDYIGRAFPYCYDEHDGSDYLLEGSFSTMDAGSTEIIAAADGTVELVHDGEYDRCHASADGNIDCDGHEEKANSVILVHDYGMRTWYWHMKTDSVAVNEGDEVRRGDVLGLVGSSGTSSFPHLHFEVVDPNGISVDPYVDPDGPEESWWCDQGPIEGLPGTCDEG